MRALPTLLLLGNSLILLQAQTHSKEDPFDEWGPGAHTNSEHKPEKRPETRNESKDKEKDTNKAVAAQALQPAAPAPTVFVEPARPPEFAAREVTREQVSKIQIGTTEKDLFSALGTPRSRIVVPDDDGHLRETCQFWAKGKPVATIRLDNERVIKVDIN